MYFREFEECISGLDDFEKRVHQVSKLGERSNLRFFWRGQANASWGVHSGLHRAVGQQLNRPVWELGDTDLVPVEERLASEALDWIRPSVGARLTTLDLFARLQHHKVPTRLVDFSRDSKVALFFACQKHVKTDDSGRHAGADGRVVIAAAHRTPSSDFLEDFSVPWRGGSPTKPNDWEKALFALDDHEDFLRISRQDGVFLVGGSPSTQPRRHFSPCRRDLRADEVRGIMSLPLVFHRWLQAEAAADGTKATGRPPTIAAALTIRVSADLKVSLVSALKKVDITYERLFPDVQGLLDYGNIVRSE